MIMIMKKNFYWLTVLMLAISCALWTGCSDDDGNNPAPEIPDETPGDTTVVTPPVTPKDTVWQVKSIKMDSPEDIGFYTLVELTRAGQQVTDVKVSKYSPQGLNGQPQEMKIAYETGKVTLSYEEYGSPKQIVYTLNAKGFATKAETFEIYEGEEPYPVGESDFVYNANGMLERIFVPMEEDGDIDLFRVTFQADTNWATCLTDPETGGMAMCKFSANKNNYTVDWNMLSIVYGFQTDVDLAVLCGLIPYTSDVLASLTLEAGGEGMKKLSKAENTAGNTVIGFKTTIVDERISVLEMMVGADAMKKFTFGY